MRIRLVAVGKRAGVLAGVLAGALGAMAVLGELCFLFPDYLVLHDSMAFYLAHLALIRGLLLATIIGAFLFGAASVALIQSKIFGIGGILLGSIALLLGGSKAEPITSQPRTFNAGLDYFLLELLVLGLVFVPMERLWALHDQKILRAGWQTDLKHFFVSHAGVQLLSFAAIIPVQAIFAWTVKLDFQRFVAAQPLVLQFLEILLFTDAVSYWVHRSFQTIRQRRSTHTCSSFRSTPCTSTTTSTIAGPICAGCLQRRSSIIGITRLMKRGSIKTSPSFFRSSMSSSAPRTCPTTGPSATALLDSNHRRRTSASLHTRSSGTSRHPTARAPIELKL